MTTHDLLIFVLAGLLLNLTPGPDVMVIVSSAAHGGRRAGVLAAFGISAGCFVHILAASVGLSALLAASATAFNALKWLGAAYLAYIGLRMLWPHPPTAMILRAPSAEAAGAGGVFWRAAATNALNPKVALFFLAFLPQFIGPQVEHKSLALLLLGLLFNLNSLAVCIGWALAADWLVRHSRTNVPNANLFVWLDRLAGLVFLGFGARLALTPSPSI